MVENREKSMVLIGKQLGLSKKVTKRLAQQMRNPNSNYTVVTQRRGRKSQLKDHHMNFLKDWLDKKRNVGKSFNQAYEAMQK